MHQIDSVERVLLETDVQSLLRQYEKRLNALDPVGLGLYGRVISCVSILRECDELFFTKDHPDHYLPRLFEKQFALLESMDETTRRLNIKGLVSQDDNIEQWKTQDDLHKELFNKTWATLKVSGDPFNDYKPYIALIEKRLRNNELNEAFFVGKKCLDVGCGTGRFSFCMAKLGAHVVGIDPGHRSIQQAEELAKMFGLDKIHFQVGNAYHLDFAQNTFDFAVCNGVLHHLDHPEKALGEIYRVMKPNGKFWLYIEGSGGIYHEVWDIICRSFDGISIRAVMHALEQMRVPNIHFWMDMFFARYHTISWQSNETRLKKIGFTKIERMKGAEFIDLDMAMFADDPYAEVKFGEGGLRMLITK